MIIDYDGQQYTFDLGDVTVKQGIKIEQYMGCSFASWGKMLQEGEDLRARQALGWLILTGGNLAMPIEDTDFKIAGLGEALNKAYAAETPADTESAEPVPTVAAGSNGHGAEAALSPVSSPQSSDLISR